MNLVVIQMNVYSLFLLIWWGFVFIEMLYNWVMKNQLLYLKDIMFVFFDIEIIGGNFVWDCIMEIGIWFWCVGEEVGEWQMLLNLEIWIFVFIENFIGIFNDMVVDVLVFVDIVDELE